MLLSPKILLGNKGHPDGEKLVSSVTRVRRAADRKISRVYRRFQVSDSSADFC